MATPSLQDNTTIVDNLREVLETFCLYRPDIGYVQGMAYIAANLLRNMDAFTAFVAFSNLIVSSAHLLN